MDVFRLDIPVLTDHGTIRLIIYEEKPKTLFRENELDALANSESPYQLKESCAYEYSLPEGYSLRTSNGIVHPFKSNPHTGRLTPGVYVGTLPVDVIRVDNGSRCAIVRLEVRSVKADYRSDYRSMLLDITEKCTDLLLRHSSPVYQYLEVDFDSGSRTLYQQFAFLRSVLDSDEFSDAVHKVLSNPVTTWEETEAEKDIRTVRRVSSSIMRQIASGSNRIDLPGQHELKRVISSLPAKVRVDHLKETVDAPVNRFVKFVLEYFLAFVGSFKEKVNDDARVKQEASLLKEKLAQWLGHSVFKEVSSQSIAPLNNPVLQRKEGYREILRAWLMFDLAAKLTWEGGDDVYDAGKRDVAVLYEYWLFFKLLEVVESIFKIAPESLDELIRPTNDGLCLQLRQGKYFPVKGVYDMGTRKLSVEFSYNRRFEGNSEYPKGGSWSRTLRPDYTLSIYPLGLDQEKAEREELITHIHFDAKYKVEKLQDIFVEENAEEEREEKRGNVKRTDLLKMHTYRDAIRRTAGAYVLYPGMQSDNKRGFHEIIPGLGAFAVMPSKGNDGMQEVKRFITDVVKHFMDRTSQREKMALSRYKTYNKKSDPLEEPLPETIGENRSLIPDETFVLVGYYRKEKLEWILQNKLYNIRIDDLDSLNISTEMAGARYLLLHGSKDETTSKLFKLKGSGPKMLSKEELLSKGYPSPSRDFYFVYEIVGEAEKEFRGYSWDVRKLPGYKKGRKNIGKPFVVSVGEIIRYKQY